ncbi:MAG: hypothetical protein WBQ17_04480 [Rhizomicrobium sp.]
MNFDIPWRRIATGAGVLVLHALFLYILAISMHLQVPRANVLRETVLNLMPPRGSHRIQQDLNIPTPRMIRPEFEPSAITIMPAINKVLQPPNANAPGDLGGVGRYLYNCSGMYYEQLSAHDRTGCLLNKWDNKPSNSPLLGVARPSPYDAVIAKRNAPAQPVEKPCDQTAINANLGLPCFDFNQH